MVIDVKNLQKYYGNTHVLKGIDLKIEKGKFFGLVGPNGAGKTTLLKILSGQIEYDSGSAKILGVSVNEKIKVKKIIGMVPEQESVPTYLTPPEYLYLCNRIRKKGNVEDTLEKFNLLEYKNNLCKDLSKGTKQRLMIAAAFFHSPDLLFLDEPFINLDPLYQKIMIDLFKNYIANGGTILMATHILEIAKKLCDEVAIIHEGMIARIVAPDDIENQFMEVVNASKDVPDRGI